MVAFSEALCAMTVERARRRQVTWGSSGGSLTHPKSLVLASHTDFNITHMFDISMAVLEVLGRSERSWHYLCYYICFLYLLLLIEAKHLLLCSVIS